MVAGVRDPSSSAAKELSSLPAGHGSSVIVVKIDSGSESDAAAAVQELKSTHHITKLDTVIANAGISTSYAPIADVPPAVLQEHVTVNAVGMSDRLPIPLLFPVRSGEDGRGERKEEEGRDEEEQTQRAG